MSYVIISQKLCVTPLSDSKHQFPRLGIIDNPIRGVEGGNLEVKIPSGGGKKYGGI